MQKPWADEDREERPECKPGRASQRKEPGTGLELESAVLRRVAHPVVNEHEGGHRLDNHGGARDDARVVAAAGLESGGGAAQVDRALGLEDRGGGFEADAEDDLLAVADAALDATRAVRQRPNGAALVDEDIVVLRALEQGAGEAAANLEALGGRERQHGLGEVGLEPVEHRLAEPGGHAAHAALDDAADGIALGAHLDLADQAEDLARNRPRRHAADGLAGGRTPAAAMITEAVLRGVGEISVRRTE